MSWCQIRNQRVLFTYDAVVKIMFMLGTQSDLIIVVLGKHTVMTMPLREWAFKASLLVIHVIFLFGILFALFGHKLIVYIMFLFHWKI